MIRLLSVLLWLLSAGVAVAFALLSGFYGWAAVLIWTILVLPSTLYTRHQLNGQWPPRTIVRLWAIAIALNLVAGIVPPFASVLNLPEAIWSVLAAFVVVAVWSGLVAAIPVLAYVTSSAIRHSLTRRPSAA